VRKGEAVSIAKQLGRLVEGQRMDWVVRYPDTHVERGRVKYLGARTRNGLPIMDPLTEHSPGPVDVLEMELIP
jgi:hypothetical protein